MASHTCPNCGHAFIKPAGGTMLPSRRVLPSGRMTWSTGHFPSYLVMRAARSAVKEIFLEISVDRG